MTANVVTPAKIPPDQPGGSRQSPNHDRRNRRSYEAILRSTLDLLTEIPYRVLTIEAIASRAGVGKATVYRWWPSKGALVAEAVSSSLTVEDPPETGDLRADLISALEISIDNYLLPPSGELVHALASDISSDEALLARFRESFLDPRRKVVGNLIRRGIDEGLLRSSCDPDLVMDMWAGALFYRGLFKHLPTEKSLAAELVDAVLAPWLATGKSVSNGISGTAASLGSARATSATGSGARKKRVSQK